jgi:hypothetical protein
MSKNTIAINGNRLKSIIEEDLKTDIYKISTDNGYSRNLVAQAIRTHKASPLVQNLMRLYNIDPIDYMEYKIEPKEIQETEDNKQITIEEITPLNREEIKELVKEALSEALNSLRWSIDPITNTVTFVTDTKPKEDK